MVFSMEKLILFINSFLSYFLLFGLTVVLCLAAAFAGIKLRKSKDLKEGKMIKEDKTE